MALSSMTSWTRKLTAGISQLTRELLRSIFLDQRVQTDGVEVVLRSGDASVRLKLNFHELLGDAEALTTMLFIKGPSGISPCGAGCSDMNKQNAAKCRHPSSH